MTTRSTSCRSSSAYLFHSRQQTALLQGEILLETKAHTAWGAAVIAQMYVPTERSQVWQQLTNYSRWEQFFPDITQSRALGSTRFHESGLISEKRLYQAASKSFLFITVQVEAYLKVVETFEQRVQFYFESGSFIDFGADLQLQDYGEGTLVRYSVQASPLIPVPSPFIQQAIHMDLPCNMRHMRQLICAANY